MKHDRVYLTHILECIHSIESYLPNGKADYFNSKMTQDAVIRNLEIIGEATKQIFKELKLENSDMPWREMAGLRDILIHEYFGVDNEIVWNVVEKEPPKLNEDITELLKSL
ncbi:DUF86 domain-containing protein [Lentibacillus sp.]|uniref:HepT-like ribonuclease domain-containing protein n=1 Tax=Lentibacillus sp. TaxID=1925746 RepID=UPI002B4B5A45|nr:DUF86 domain-containing protein [Lentibacillus sp.]HLS08494.1 DUF86 domain-containing protein [Lentibacillus sp.]